MKDHHNNILAAVALNPQQVNSNTTVVGPIIDRNTFESVEFLLYNGALTTGVYKISLEEGNDPALADTAAVAEANLLPNTSATQANGVAYTSAQITVANSVKRLGYVGTKRYVRLSVTSTTVVTTGTLIGAACILGSPDISPTVAN